MDIANCPRCGRLFARHFRDICQRCYADIEQEYELCLAYLKKNKACTITELSDETGVSIKQITRFIKEGRISLKDAPNMAYPCEVCGVLIQHGSMCGNCLNRLRADIREATSPSSSNSESQRTTGTYQIGDRLKER